MLDLRSAISGALGATFTVTHQGGPVTINVGIEGQDDETALPCVFIAMQAGTSNPSNIGGGGAENRTFCDLLLMALDSDDIDGATLITDIHSAVETTLRAVEKSLGASFYSHISTFRDRAAHHVGGVIVYERTLTIHGQNFQSY